MSISNYYEFGPDAADVKSLVIMLHGVGSNGQDLISLAPYMAKTLPGTMFVSPDAPFPCDMVPPGYPNSFQWFSLQDRDPHAMLSGVQSAFPLVEEFVEIQKERFALPADKIALLGFSQGTMTSLHCAPRFKEKIAGVLGYSGALLLDERDSVQRHILPVHLIHGQADDVVPVEAWAHAKSILESKGYTVSGHTTPGLPHSIDQDGIESGTVFLRDILA